MKQHQILDLGLTALVLQFWLRRIQSQDSDISKSLLRKLTEAGEGSCGRSDPAELCGFREQVIEAKEEHLELWEKKGKDTCTWGKKRGKGSSCSGERVCQGKKQVGKGAGVV